LNFSILHLFFSTCTNGAWECTKKKCDKTCSATGDPHYMTFDGKRFNFMGKCSYYMIKESDNFNVYVNNKQCGHSGASCTESVDIDYNHHIIKLGHNHELSIDNQPLHKLPYENDGIKLHMVSSLFMKVRISSITGNIVLAQNNLIHLSK